MDRCLAGDQAAWRLFVDAHSRLVYSIPRRYGFDDASCDDVFQTVFLAAFRNLASLRDAQSVPKWLITTTVRACGRQARRRGVTLTEPPPAAMPEPEVHRRERLHALHGALELVGERCRSLLLLLYGSVSTPSYDAAAETLGIPRGSLGPTRQRCLEKLARALAEDGHGRSGGDAGA